MKNLNTKVFKLDIKEVDEKQGVIKGYASTFGNVDYGNDIVDKGAFKKSIKESKGRVPILADHDPDKLIGFNKGMEEDDHGLYIEGHLNMDVQLARERWSLAKQAADMGTSLGLSIGYTTIKEEVDRNDPKIRRIKEVRLWEYSMVTFPMNPEAFVTAAKSWSLQEKEMRVKSLIEELKSLEVTDDEILKALGTPAAPDQMDPTLVSQSLDRLLKNLKGE